MLEWLNINTPDNLQLTLAITELNAKLKDLEHQIGELEERLNKLIEGLI